jgi:hypothetical protein
VRGDDQQTSHLFSYLSLEQRVPVDHPLRQIRDDGRGIAPDGVVCSRLLNQAAP